jgi:hypothetical protein
MATAKEVKKGICDGVYTELAGVKEQLLAIRGKLGSNFGKDTATFGLFDRHLGELVDQIDWKIQILSHACPYDWKGSSASEYEENTVSVGPPDKSAIDFSGGYLGG